MMSKSSLGINGLALLSALIHAVLIFCGEWQDRHMRVAYTDIDYWVYSDAARHVYNGASAFDRHTYRYTPLLAWMLVPNELVGLWWGKALFSLAGVVSGILIYRITNKSLTYASLWLFSPLTINISTRGSSDSLIILLILLVFHDLQRGRLLSGAAWFGLSVHLRIFPIFFVVPIMAYIGLSNWRQIVKFGFVSGAVCVGLIGLFYIKDGFRFIYEAYLYHFVRKDHRHNFSLFYYAIYLASAEPSSALTRILTFSGFLPQLGSLLFVGIRFGRENFMFAIFLQTIIFVAFNKVITAQYFLWYFGLLPVALYAVLDEGAATKKTVTVIQIVVAIMLWGIAEVFWLKASYGLEVEGKHNFRTLLAASACLFVAHIGLLVVFIRAFIAARRGAKEQKELVQPPPKTSTSSRRERSATPPSSSERRSRSRTANKADEATIATPRRSSRLKQPIAEK